MDTRFSQYFNLGSDSLKLQVFGEFTNLFNGENVRDRVDTVAIDFRERPRSYSAGRPVPTDPRLPGETVPAGREASLLDHRG